MLKKIIDKRNYIILLIIIILFIWILFFNKQEIYIKTFNYYGEEITFKVYDKVNHKELTNDINNIYKKYEKVNDLKGKINEDEKALIEYGKIAYYKSNGFIDITSGELFDSLKNDKVYNFESKINDIEIKNNVLVNDISFNFDNIIGSYATNEVIYYFKQNDIKEYLISENGDIMAGEHYENGKYNISLMKPNSDEVLMVISLEKKAMATRNTVSEFKSYMVNPKTSKKENKYDGVVVIANDNLTANMLVNSLYLMDLDEGKKLVQSYNGEALWIDGDDLIKTDGFDKYVKNN